MAIDLIVIDMLDFDVMHNMHFLNKYEAEIEHRKKKVWFNLDNNGEFIFREGRVFNMMINNVRDTKMLI